MSTPACGSLGSPPSAGVRVRAVRIRRSVRRRARPPGRRPSPAPARGPRTSSCCEHAASRRRARPRSRATTHGSGVMRGDRPSSASYPARRRRDGREATARRDAARRATPGSAPPPAPGRRRPRSRSASGGAAASDHGSSISRWRRNSRDLQIGRRAARAPSEAAQVAVGGRAEADRSRRARRRARGRRRCAGESSNTPVTRVPVAVSAEPHRARAVGDLRRIGAAAQLEADVRRARSASSGSSVPRIWRVEHLGEREPGRLLEHRLRDRRDAARRRAVALPQRAQHVVEAARALGAAADLEVEREHREPALQVVADGRVEVRLVGLVELDPRVERRSARGSGARGPASPAGAPSRRAPCRGSSSR